MAQLLHVARGQVALEASGECGSAILEVVLLDLLAHAGDDILHLAFVVAEAVRQRCIPVPELIVLVGGEHQVMVDLPVAIDVL